MFDNLKYTLLTFLYICFSLSVMGQEKTDVEIHVGSKYDIYIDNSTTARHANGGVLSVELTYGKHTVTATLPSYTKVTKTFTVTTDYKSQIVRINNPKPIYGSLAVSSEPDSLEVFVDGKSTGKYTPMQVDSLLVKDYTILLKSSGYYDYSKSVTVSDKDTARLYAQLKKKETKPVNQPSYTSNSSSSSSYNTGTTYSGTYRPSSASGSRSSNHYTSKTEDNFDKVKVNYFGLGVAVGTNFSAQLSICDVRYKYIEVRPLVWGVSGSILKNLPHTKLPPAIVRNEPDYYDYYDYARPERGAQWYYTPSVRCIIPIRKGWSHLFIGIGPQFSWTKIKWKEDNGPLTLVDSYEFTNQQFPMSAYQKDSPWFTCELGMAWQFSEKIDFEMSLRYQDGFVLAVDIKFGKMYDKR